MKNFIFDDHPRVPYTHNYMNRVPVKYIRDFIKKDFDKKSYCEICGDTENLELHHLYTLSELWDNWCEKHNISGLDVLIHREQFVQDNLDKVNDTVTLCKPHHLTLHRIYGQQYSNHMTPKVKKWITIQKEKNGFIQRSDSQT